MCDPVAAIDPSFSGRFWRVSLVTDQHDPTFSFFLFSNKTKSFSQLCWYALTTFFFTRPTTRTVSICNGKLPMSSVHINGAALYILLRLIFCFIPTVPLIFCSIPIISVIFCAHHLFGFIICALQVSPCNMSTAMVSSSVL